MKKVLLLFLVVIAGVLVAADFALKSLAERRMASAFEAALDIPAEADVSVDAFPFVLSTLQGRYPAVTVTARDVGGASLRLTRLSIEFSDVEFSLGNLLSGNERRVLLGSGQGRAVVSQRDLNRSLRRNDVPARVDLRAAGGVEVRSTDGSATAGADITVDGGNLIVTPEGGLPSFSLELPRFGENMSYESVDVRGSTARLGVSVGETVAEF